MQNRKEELFMQQAVKVTAKTGRTGQVSRRKIH